jgi:hypothetical protein
MPEITAINAPELILISLKGTLSQDILLYTTVITLT